MKNKPIFENYDLANKINLSTENVWLRYYDNDININAS